MYLRKKFYSYLDENKVKLTPMQKRISKLLIDEADKDDAVFRFLTLPMVGTTYIFNTLEKWFKGQSPQ